MSLHGSFARKLPTDGVVGMFRNGPRDKETSIYADHSQRFVGGSRKSSSISARLVNGRKMLPTETGAGGEIRLGLIAGVLMAISKQ